MCLRWASSFGGNLVVHARKRLLYAPYHLVKSWKINCQIPLVYSINNFCGLAGRRQDNCQIFLQWSHKRCTRQMIALYGSHKMHWETLPHVWRWIFWLKSYNYWHCSCRVVGMIEYRSTCSTAFCRDRNFHLDCKKTDKSWKSIYLFTTCHTNEVPVWTACINNFIYSECRYDLRVH